MNDTHPEELLSAYMDNELGPEEKRLVEAHLDVCEQCRALKLDLLRLHDLAAAHYGKLEAPPGLELRVLHAVGEAPAVRPPSKAWLALPFAGIMLLTAIWLLAGHVLLKVGTGLFKLTAAFVYFLPRLLTSLPLLAGVSAVLVAAAAVASGVVLRQLLHGAASEEVDSV